jgi:membrane protein DedA with SNARE-associated domain
MLENFDKYGYVGIFIALLAAGFGFPIPEELPVITAGILVGHGDTNLRWYIMLPVVIAGVVTADGLLYGVGRLWGRRLLEIGWVQRRLLPPEKREQIERNFAARGILVLLGARLLPGIRTPIFLMAGVLRVPLIRFLIADGIYAIPLVNLLFWLSYVLTDQVLVVFRQIQKVQEEYRPLVIVAVLSGIAGVLIHKYLFSRRVVVGDPAEVPTLIARPAEVITQALESAVEKVTRRSHHETSQELLPPPEPEHSPNTGLRSEPDSAQNALLLSSVERDGVPPGSDRGTALLPAPLLTPASPVTPSPEKGSGADARTDHTEA